MSFSQTIQPPSIETPNPHLKDAIDAAGSHNLPDVKGGKGTTENSYIYIYNIYENENICVSYMYIYI